MKQYWETVADNLKRVGWSLGRISAIDSNGRTIWIVDAHRDGKRFVVRADGRLTAPRQTEEGDTRIRGGFDLVNHFVVAVWRAKKGSSLGRIVLTAFRQVSQYRAGSSCLGVSPWSSPDPLSAGQPRTKGSFAQLKKA